jgi:hypothetical protein
VPFRAMVDVQIECARLRRGARVRRKVAPLPRRPPVPPSLCDRTADLVCVAGEANAWPYRSPEREAAYPDELVQWAACRIATGEAFDFVVSPQNPLSSGTPRHIGLTAERILAGGTGSDLLERWRAFVRDTDVICSWGRYATSLFVSAGGHLPPGRVDLRQVARAVAKAKVGTLDEYAAEVTIPDGQSLASGRAGTRLSQIAGIARHFAEIAQAWRDQSDR